MSFHVVAGGEKRKLTCKPSLPGTKHPLMLTGPREDAIQDEVDLRCGLPKFDQGRIGSCVDNAWVKMALQLHVKELVASGMAVADAVELAVKSILSRLMLYFYVRAAEGTPRDEDSGSQVATAGQVYTTLGVCLESTYDYSDPEVRFSLEPPQEALDEAVQHRALLYFHLPDMDSILRCLSDGFSLVLGLSVYRSMETEPCSVDGIIPMPVDADGNPMGGHCVHIVGYKWIKGKRRLIVDNSWSDAVADHGDYYLDVDYMVFDAMTLRRAVA